MEKQTLKFPSLVNLAAFARAVNTGYLMNTNNLTLTGKFSPIEIDRAVESHNAFIIETSEKVYLYS